MNAANARKSLPLILVLSIVFYCSLFATQAWAAGWLTAGSAADPSADAPLQAQAAGTDYSFSKNAEGNPAITVKGVTEGLVTYLPKTNTLSLKNVKMKGIYVDGCEQLTVYVIGENTGSDVFLYDMNCGQDGVHCDVCLENYGFAVGSIWCAGDLTIKNTNVTANGKDTVDHLDTMWRDGITCNGNITIENSVVNASAAGHADEYGGAAIFAEGDIFVKEQALITLAGNKNATCISAFGDIIVEDRASLSVTGKQADGIRAKNVHVKGGSVSATVQGNEVRAIETDEDLTIDGGKVVATSSSDFEAVCCCGSLTMNGGSLNVTSTYDAKGKIGKGIAVRSDAALKVNGGTFDAKTADYNNALAVSAGKVTFSSSCTKKIIGGVNAKNYLVESGGNTYKVTTTANWQFEYWHLGVTLIGHTKGVTMPDDYKVEIDGYIYLIDAVKAKASIAEANVKASSATYTGKALKPAVKVTHAGRTLAEGVEYTVKYKNNVKAGTGKAIVTGKASGFFKGKKTVKFTIAKASIAKAKAAKVKKQKLVKVGKAVKPAVTVKFAGKKLKAGRDYTITYKNNTKKGTAKAIVKGKGNFKGKKTIKFKIV